MEKVEIKNEVIENEIPIIPEKKETEIKKVNPSISMVNEFVETKAFEINLPKGIRGGTR